MRWDEFQKYIFAKKSLAGLAKLHIQEETGVSSYRILKSKLLEEFRTKTNSAKVHKMLAERKIHNDEEVHEYFLKMKELASRVNIEFDALMHYVVEGITDDPNLKLMLMGATNQAEFKKKLDTFKNMRELKSKTDVVKRHRVGSESRNESRHEKKREVVSRCFNCDVKGHKSDVCDQRKNGPKCFVCNKYGHIAKQCKEKRGIETTNKPGLSMVGNVNHNVCLEGRKKFKEVRIQD